MIPKDTPNPGSREAIEQGCTCPVMDDAHGRGIPWGQDGGPQFWINAHCPLHGTTPADQYAAAMSLPEDLQ